MRGFAGGFYPHLQALVDGRVIYNELFSGVYWDVQTPLLEDVESIEVIRGPGATLWGANAVNGVVNVTTKSAHDTHGGYASGGGGTEERAFGMARYGTEVADGISVRGWGRYFQRDGLPSRSGGSLSDDWSVEGGELSPTLKVKRHVVSQRYAGEIESCYETESPSGPGPIEA